MRFLRYLLPVVLLIFIQSTSHAQTVKLVGGNTLIGATNGALVGLGVMGLNQSADFSALRIGLGFGTLYGLGMGAYDISRYDSELGFYQVEGFFNTAEYSSMIVLLDSFYGGVSGTVIGLAVSLIVNEPIGRGLRYGGGIGIIGGFAFGLVEIFHFNKDTGTFIPQESAFRQVDGFFNIQGINNMNIGMLNPVLMTTPDRNTLTGDFSLQTSAAIQIANVKVFF